MIQDADDVVDEPDVVGMLRMDRPPLQHGFPGEGAARLCRDHRVRDLRNRSLDVVVHGAWPVLVLVKHAV